jgi:hypothetical protein
MSDIDDIDSGESGGELLLAEGAIAAGVALSAICLACGAAISGPFCSACGQKNDDLRRGIFQLAKDFMGDTFGFDSRMWRTLGTLASSPGRVPQDYAHGKRSRFTPPVRLFVVVSFLFFLTIGLTNTLFVALEVDFKQDAAAAPAASDAADGAAVEQSDSSNNCSFQAQLRFFVKERDLHTDMQRLDACMGEVGEQVRGSVASADGVIVGEDEGLEEERRQAEEVVGRVFTGLNSVVANPRAFNDSFNDWLPRVLLAMTPVLALILTLFLRRSALVFDHLVLSFYSHAVGFAIIGLSLILAQFGAPMMGYAAFLGIGIYYVAELKKTYKRGWVKTIWTALISGGLYLLILLSIIVTIMSNIVWQATA